MSRRDKPHWPAPISQSERRPGRPVTPLIEVPAEGLGPAMLALNPAMRAFVVAKITHGCSNAKAAKLAGYSVRSPHAADVHGSRLAHDERVQAAILEEGQKLMRSHGPKSIVTIAAIRDDKRLDAQIRLKAAVELLNRSGFVATTQHNVTVEHHLSDAEKDRRILALCSELGLGEAAARKMLIEPDRVIEGEFIEVEPLPPAEAAKRERENTLRRSREAMTPEELAAHKAAKREERRARAKAKFAAASDAPSTEGIEDLLR